MINFSKLWVYRMTHIDNVSHIAMNGLTHVDSENSNPNYIPIGNKEIITVRANRLLNNGRHIGSYLPFYWSQTVVKTMHFSAFSFQLLKMFTFDIWNINEPEDIVYHV